MNRVVIGIPDKTPYLLQCLQEDFSHGVTIVDTTGDFARQAVNTVPIRLTQQVLYFDPTDMAHPPGFNVLEAVLEDDRQPLTEQICAYFDAMFPEGEATLARANARYILANCLRVLLDNDGSTLLGVLKLLSDKPYRSRLLEQVTDPVVLKNWVSLEDKQYQPAIALLLTKIGALLMSPMIRNIVGQKESTLVGAKIIIANLDRAKIGDLTAKLLGGLLIARSSGTVYLPDLSFFATDYLASLLPQSRFTVALDFLGQVRRVPALHDALLSIEEKVVLKTNRNDAETLAHYFGLPNPDVLIDMKADHVRTSEGVFEPEAPPNLNRLKVIRKRTRAVHTRTRAKVERDIKEFLA